MNRFALAAVILAATAAPGAAATLGIEIFDNGALIDNVTGITTGAASIVANDANFANIVVSAQGSPILPRADLSSVTLDATASATFSGVHILTVDVLQGAISGRGNTLSTFTINGLVNDPGPTTENSFAGGVLQATHTFPIGQLDGSVGPLSGVVGAFTTDELQYSVAFTIPSQSFGGSSQLTTGVPELSTWAMLVTGFAFMAWGAWARKRVSSIRIDSLT